MAFVHGKNTYVSLDGTDLSPFTNNTEAPEEADTHDTTTYGKDNKTYAGGLKDGTFTISGIYDSDETAGPRAVIKPIIGATVPFIFRPEGTGDGLPEDSADVVVQSYSETSPVADMITWTAELQRTGPTTSAPQPTA